MPKNDYSENDILKLNKEIKEVCKLAEINNIITGSKSKSIEIGEKKRTKRYKG